MPTAAEASALIIPPSLFSLHFPLHFPLNMPTERHIKTEKQYRRHHQSDHGGPIHSVRDHFRWSGLAR